MDATISRAFIRSRYVMALALIGIGGLAVLYLAAREVALYRAAAQNHHEAHTAHMGVLDVMVAASDRAMALSSELADPDPRLATVIDGLEGDLAAMGAPWLADPVRTRTAFADFIGIARKMSAPLPGVDVDLLLHQSILFSIAEAELSPLLARTTMMLADLRDRTWDRLVVLAFSALAGLALVLTFAALMIFRPMERHILHVQLALERETARAQDAERSKGAFLANMSHELRTALNGVIGMTEVLARTRLDAGQADYVGLMRASGAAVLRLINDILDFSKIAADEMELEIARFEPRRALVETARLCAPMVDARGVRMILDIDPALPGSALGDAVRLRQIVANLLQNAAKFTREGHVVLSADWRATTRTLEVTVRDTGVGIPADKLGDIFGAFQQVDNALTPKSHGAGLGLAISKMLVERMGGRLTVESVEGEGSAFRFAVQLGATPAAVPAAPALQGVRVALAVEDARLAAALLRPLRAEGAEVLVAAAASAIGGAFDAVVCEGGAQSSPAGTWRAQAPDARIVALAPPGVVVAGTDATVSTPVDPAALVAALSRAEVDAAPGESAAAPRRGLRVLVAEDNAINQLIARRLLEDLGCEVDVVEDGVEAVRVALQERPDLVLMDVSMPRMTGLEATGAIRRAEAALGRRTAIVAMTAHAMDEHRERCLEAGMDDRLAKPFRPEDLAAMLDRWAPRREPATDNLPATALDA